jgi:hypothetical protein
MATLAPAAHASRAWTSGRSVSASRDRALAVAGRDRALNVHRQHSWRGSPPRARAAVVGGVQDSIEQVPWQVAVLATFEVDGQTAAILCGGSVIDLSHIVTAAHCAYDPVTGQPLRAASFVVLAGVSSITVEEIEDSPTLQARLVQGSRVHPYFDYAAGPGTGDDVAVLALAEPLTTSSAVTPIALPSSPFSPEGIDASLSGFGEENPSTEELNERLYSLGITLGPSRACGGEAEAVFLCGKNIDGSACNGDSGGGLVNQLSGGPTLIGVVDTVQIIAGERCRDDALDGFVNLGAGEVRDFVEGSDDPPPAPRGGGVVIRGVPTVGQPLTCEPGSWSGAPSFTYTFFDNASQTVLQQGASPSYDLSEADLGRTISCQVEAVNPGGTGTVRTVALAPVKHAPPVPRPPSDSGGGGSITAGDGGGGGSNTAGGGGLTPEPSPTPSSNVPVTPGRGGVAGYSITNIGSGQIATLLGHEITPGASAKAASVFKKGGYTVRFSALEAGTVTIRWYQLPAGAALARKAKAKPILVASGHASFTTAGASEIKLVLTQAGRRLLGSIKNPKLVAKGIFTPSGAHGIDATRDFVLRR